MPSLIVACITGIPSKALRWEQQWHSAYKVQSVSNFYASVGTDSNVIQYLAFFTLCVLPIHPSDYTQRCPVVMSSDVNWFLSDFLFCKIIGSRIGWRIKSKQKKMHEDLGKIREHAERTSLKSKVKAEIKLEKKSNE